MVIKEMMYCISHPFSMAKMNLSFSQDGEDIIVKNILGSQEKKGIYIDVGAHHPMRFSNTFYFYLHGWRGINIDAMPGSMKPFNKYRREDKNIEAGISRTGEKLVFYEFDDAALNTFDKVLADENVNDGYKIVREQEIQTYRIMDIFDKYVGKRQIDILDIDIEGMDDLIIEDIDWKKYRPKVVLAEKNYRIDKREICPNPILSENGYILMAMTNLTSIYVLKDVVE